MMTTTPMEIARERQLDWLLAEVLGTAGRSHTHRSTKVSRPWLAAALVVLGAGVAFATAALRKLDRDGTGAQITTPLGTPSQHPGPQIQWRELHGESAIDKAPVDATALRCFDFTNAGLAQLARFHALQHLDLSGMDPDARGTRHSLQITDDGVRHLVSLTSLRWLSLAQCQDVMGTTLAALRAIPRLEHLDLAYTTLTSKGIAELPQLPSLRELVLSHCIDFHGHSLADVARLPGLRRLELRGCSTVKAADVMQLVALHELQHLDLRDCMGGFKGQTVSLDDITNSVSQDQPTQDSIGVTDAAIAALVQLPLTTLLLDGCRSLTDEVSTSLAKMKSLRSVGLGELPLISTVALQRLPLELRELSLNGNRQFGGANLFPVEQLPAIEVLSLNGVDKLSDGWLLNVTRQKPLRTLGIGGTRRMGEATGPDGAFRAKLTPAVVAKVLAGLPTLEQLDATYSDWFDAEVAAAAAQLPNLHSIDLQSAALSKKAFAALGASHSLRELRLVEAQGVDVAALEQLGKVPLRDLDLFRCRDLKLKDMGLFESWPGVRVRLPNGTRYVEPDRTSGK